MREIIFVSIFNPADVKNNYIENNENLWTNDNGLRPLSLGALLCCKKIAADLLSMKNIGNKYSINLLN